MADYNQVVKRIDNLINRNKINALSASVFNKTDVLFSHSSGICEKSFKKGVDHRYTTGDTKFLIGSFSKLLTAIAIMQLHDKGKVSLFEEIHKYLPEFSIKNRFSETEITVRDILNNRSGIPSINYNMFLKEDTSDYHEVLNYLKDQYLICPPKAMEASSDLGYTLLGLVVEKMSQMNYEDYLNEAIFKPMEIDAKFIHEAGDYQTYRSLIDISYDALGQETQEPIKSLIPARCNIYLSINDLVKIGRLFINDGKYKETEILAKDSVDSMLEEPFFKGEVDGITKSGLGLSFSQKYKNTLGKVLIANGRNFYNQVSMILLKERGLCSVVMADSFMSNALIEDICASLLETEAGVSCKLETSNGKASYLQCRVEDYAGVYPARDGQAVIYLDKFFALKYKDDVYKMRLRQDGYFELSLTNKLFKKKEKKLALIDEKGLLSITSTLDDGRFDVEMIGYPTRSVEISSNWKKALGSYKLSNPNYNNPFVYDKMKLTIENGYLVMIMYRNLKKRVITLGIVNSKEAIALGYGANSNDTVILNLSNIRYCGLSFNKVKESSLNKVKVKKVNEEKIRRREHKKKINKMFDFK